MGDFFQTGLVATFHNFQKANLMKIETELEQHTRVRPLVLVLPSLIIELHGEGLGRIVNELRHVGYLKEIVVTLGPAEREEFDKVRKIFSALPQRIRVLWNSGKNLTRIYKKIEKAGLYTGEEGKGRSVWMACGYTLSLADVHAVALHDCDILTYDRSLLARLCYPVINPNLDYEFAKGYYSRVTDRMHGRVTRLLVTPLIRSLQKILGYLPLLDYLDSFRYALAGEFAMDASLARINKVPGDWGLEMGILSEVYRNTAVRRICQVDLTDNYEHKHQELSFADPKKGLHKMAIDVCKSILRTLKSEGIVLPDRFFRTLVSTYSRIAGDMLKRYEDDAAINGLLFYRHEETRAIETFMSAIKIASDAIMGDPIGPPSIESWDRVTSAVPDIFDLIREAVEEDNR